MTRSLAKYWPLALLVFVPAAAAQTYEELRNENQRLKARIEALEAKNPEGVIVSYDSATGKLVVKVGDRERTLQLKPRTHVHDPGGREVRSAADRAEKLKPGVRIEIVEENGQLEEINIRGERGQRHAHADGEWRFVDPVYPGWWRPTDDYRPYSWMPPAGEGFCQDLLGGRFVETHRSPRGTPWVHPFTIEPPQMHRDLFFIYKYAKDAEGGPTDEHEAEFHFDWALTRRLGFALGVPYLGLLGPDEQATGFGDLEFAPRVVLIESDTFFLSTNILFTFPTGDRSRDLGRGETTIAPFLTTWNDLGSWGSWQNWNTLFVNFGPEVGLESGDTVLQYTVVLAHSFLGPRLFFPHQHLNGNGHQHNNGHQHDGHQHDKHAHDGQGSGGTISHFGPAYPAGLTSIILEVSGETELQGEGITLMQMLTGFAYAMTESGEFRLGVSFPLNRPQQQFDSHWFFAFSYLF